MFDKLSEAAESLATNVSRRAFLGRLGQGALVVAGVLGGMLAAASTAQAYGCPSGTSQCGARLGNCCPKGQWCCRCNTYSDPGHCSTTRQKGCACFKV